MCNPLLLFLNGVVELTEVFANESKLVLAGCS